MGDVGVSSLMMLCLRQGFGRRCESQPVEDVFLEAVLLGRCCESQSVDDVLVKAVMFDG